MVKERDLIGTQLVRRNDEASLLYEKIKIIENTLHKGERQYKERLEDIRVLKLEIHNQRCKNNTLAKNTQVVTDLRLTDSCIVRRKPVVFCTSQAIRGHLTLAASSFVFSVTFAQIRLHFYLPNALAALDRL